MKIKQYFLSVVLLGFGVTGLADDLKKWVLLPEQSRLKFVFEQAGSDETGRFDSFDAVFWFNPGFGAGVPAEGHFEVSINMASVNTGDDERDQILRSGDMFAVKQSPQAFFRVATIRHIEKNRYLAEAELQIRDRSHKITFPFTLAPETREGGQKAFRMRSTVTIKRLDFGVGQGDWAETTWVSDKVQVEVDVLGLSDK